MAGFTPNLVLSCKDDNFRLQEEGIFDILSGLPRNVLDEIFERMPVKDAARTSILSRKWRYIWYKYPYLVFDQQFFLSNIAHRPFFPSKYVNVIDKILLIHDGPVLKFSLYIPNVACHWIEHIDRWLLILSKNGIRQLVLDYKSPIPYKLPSYVFKSPDLAHLEVKNCIFKPPDTFFGFEKLVILKFRGVSFGANTFAGRSPVAPLLSTLTFSLCRGVENFNIFAPQLKKIRLCCNHKVNSTFFEKFPNLVVIFLAVVDILEVANQGKGWLVTFRELHQKFPKIEVFSFDGSFLRLSAPTTFEPRPSLTFQSLKMLMLNFVSFNDSDQISCVFWLLNSTPSLQIFEITFLQAPPSAVTASESVLSLLPHLEASDCVGEMLKLRSVELKNLEDSKQELLLIKCILANSPILEDFHVKFGFRDKDRKFRMFKEFMQYRRASCKVGFIFSD